MVVSALLPQRIEIAFIEMVVLESALLNQFESCPLIKLFADVISFLL